MHAKIINVGDIFFKNRVIEELPRGRKKNGTTYRKFLCECTECGERYAVSINRMTTGHFCGACKLRRDTLEYAKKNN